MITREEYNKALDIVEAYQKQLFIGDFRRALSWNDLKIGSRVVFKKIMSKYLTIDKEYEVIWVTEEWKEYDGAWFTIIDDNNKRRSLKKHAQGYLMSIV